MAVNAYGQYTISIVDDGVGIKSKQDYYTLSNQKDSLDGAKSYFEKEASGAIASFSDGAEDAPMSVTVDIDPVQDLHGYANPWPAGGGKNLFDKTKVANVAERVSVEQIDNGFKITNLSAGTYRSTSFYADFAGHDGETVYLKGNVSNSGSNNGYFSVRFYDDTSEISTASTRVELYSTRTSHTGTVPTGTTRVAFVIYGTGSSSAAVGDTTTFTNVIFSLSDVSYSPYSNICPISGWTGAKVTRTGRNLIELSFNQVNVSNILSNVFEMKAGTYTLSFNYNGTPTWGVYLRNGTTASSPVIKQAYNANNLTFTLDKDYQELCISVYYANGISVSEVTNAQIEKGSTAHAYEPYTAVTREIPFSTEVYGGTLNVETGELVVDRKTDIADGNAIRIQGLYSNGCAYTFNVADMYNDSAYAYQRVARMLSDKLMASPFISIGSNQYAVAHSGGNRAVFNIPTCTTVAEYNAWLSENRPQIVYYLATPITLTLTPVEIRSLLGDNNVWSDTGDVSVTYISEQDLTWETEPLVPNEEGKYLWWKYKITKDDDSTWESDPAVIGMFSDSDRVLANIEKAQNTADFAQGAAQMAQSSANYAQDAADRAQQSANNAQSSADQANEGVTNLRSEVASNYVTIADFSVSNESIQSSVTEVRTIAEAAQLSADTNYSDLSGNLEDLEGRVSTNETSISSIVTATSNLEQRADSINLTVSEHTREIEELQGYTTGLKATMNLTASGLDISGGDTTSDTHVHINGDGVSITDGTNTPAYFHGQESKMINVEITEILRIGNHKLLARSGGTNTTVVYVGDE